MLYFGEWGSWKVIVSKKQKNTFIKKKIEFCEGCECTPCDCGWGTMELRKYHADKKSQKTNK